MWPVQDPWDVVRTRRTHKVAAFLMRMGYYSKRQRDIHWTMKDWPEREDLIPGSKNVVQDNLIDNRKIFYPP